MDELLKLECAHGIRLQQYEPVKMVGAVIADIAVESAFAWKVETQRVLAANKTVFGHADNRIALIEDDQLAIALHGRYTVRDNAFESCSRAFRIGVVERTHQTCLGDEIATLFHCAPPLRADQLPVWLGKHR